MSGIIIEEDRGTYTRSRHPHNGYYAGDFSISVGRPAVVTSMPVLRTSGHPSEGAHA